MAVAGGLDLHRGQLTFDYVDTGTGESWRGRICPADRESLRGWLRRFDGVPDVEFAVEGCTGWRYVVEELQRAGITAHLAEPAETAGLRGRKRRAKTDWADARHLRDLLLDGRIPESWIPPAHVLEARALVRLYKDLLEERTSWQQRVHATLFHQGIPVVPKLGTADGQQRLEAAELSAAGRRAVQAGLRQIERLTQEMASLRRELARLSSRQPGCRALRRAHYGIGGLLSVAVWAELGDCRRFPSSDDAVRHTGLDITIYDSDGKRARGHIARQGPPVLRWALYEAALYASRPAPRSARPGTPSSPAAAPRRATSPRSPRPASCSPTSSTRCATGTSGHWTPPPQSTRPGEQARPRAARDRLRVWPRPARRPSS